MTLDELLARESIRQTLARYTWAGDRLREAEFVSVFTEEAILESEAPREADRFCLRGKAEIRDWIRRWRNGSGDKRASAHRASFVRHHLSTCDIELTGPHTAVARSYWAAYTDIGVDHCGYYLDALQKVGDDWLLTHRRIRLDWRAENSLFFDAVANTR